MVHCRNKGNVSYSQSDTTEQLNTHTHISFYLSPCWIFCLHYRSSNSIQKCKNYLSNIPLPHTLVHNHILLYLIPKYSQISLSFLPLPYLSGFPGGTDGKESACKAGDLGLIPGSGRFSGEGNRDPLQYSCLENSMDSRAWWVTVHGVTKRWTQWSNFPYFLSSYLLYLDVASLYIFSVISRIGYIFEYLLLFNKCLLFHQCIIKNSCFKTYRKIAHFKNTEVIWISLYISSLNLSKNLKNSFRCKVKSIVQMNFCYVMPNYSPKVFTTLHSHRQRMRTQLYLQSILQGVNKDIHWTNIYCPN